MIARILETKIRETLRNFPITALLGSRQVGKTTLAKTLGDDFERPVVYLDLELPSDLNKLQSPELYLRKLSDSLVIIDEVQRLPELFPLLRSLVDQHRCAGRFLLLGSASPDLIRHSSESLAGRICYHELAPFALAETGTKSIDTLWLRGGYPQSFLAATHGQSMIWRQEFIATYLERDLPQLGIRIPAAQLRRFWTMLAHSNGQLWNASQLASSMGLSPTTIRHYLDILQDTFLVRQLQPWFVNTGKRLVKSPKIYLRDAGLLHALMQLNSIDRLMAHPGVGNSWEGFVVEQLLNIMPDNYQPFFYRTSAGAEIDLVFVDGNTVIAVEIKLSATPKLSKGFWNGFADLNCRQGFVVYPGDERYPIAENVDILPVAALEQVFAD